MFEDALLKGKGHTQELNPEEIVLFNLLKKFLEENLSDF